MKDRALIGLWVLLITLDELADTLISILPFVIGGGEPPNPRRTISMHAGRAAAHGRAMGRIAAGAIDALAKLLGDGPGHCARRYADAVARGWMTA